ncbi:hypothetical protein KC959_00610, partial [Candidatus Saccharibacteria bacterium]|nr:hypothetical protein [Candidatus Saccharibacteria bacterium]
DGLTDTSNFVISRAPAGALSGTLSTYTLSNVINPSTADVTVYVRIELFASADTSGPAFDQGAIAFSTNGKFSVGAFVPPFLAFCVGVTVASDCSSTSGSLVDFGELSPNSTSSTTTQFAGATNDPTGMQIFLNGQTMTSGNNVINALNSAASSSVGSSQFGINLRQNSQPSVGANRTGLGSINPDAGYGTSNQYKFNSGDRIARSTLPTEYNVFTVSYIANVPEDQPPGVYATTLLYTALVSF